MSANTRRARKRRKARAKTAQRAAAAELDHRKAARTFTAAVHALIDPQPHPQPGHTAPSRYDALRQALYTHHGGNGNHTQAHTIPASIDALKYLTEIDALARRLDRQYPPAYCRLADAGRHPTIRLLAGVATHRWHRDDRLEQIRNHTNLLTGYARRIDDLLAAKPLYLPDACPQCGHRYAHKLNDEGDVVRTPGALAVTAEHGAVCQQCHRTWRPDQLQFLGRLLGYRPLAGVTSPTGD